MIPKRETILEDTMRLVFFLSFLKKMIFKDISLCQKEVHIHIYIYICSEKSNIRTVYYRLTMSKYYVRRLYFHLKKKKEKKEGFMPYLRSIT